MDATNDIVCGTCVNYNWNDISNYAMSLSRSGFKGRKVLFVSNLNIAARVAVMKLGFEIVDFTPTMKNVVVERFKIIHDWLVLQPFTRYVIHADVRDVVIQTDPSLWMEKQTKGIKLFGASECIVYKDEACNPFWVEQLFGHDTLESLNNEEVVCAGTIAGEYDTVVRLTRRIFEMSTDRFGDDQAALNVLLRSEFKDVMRIPGPEESWILTAGWWLVGAIQGNKDAPIGRRSKLVKTPPELRDGVAYPVGSSVPFCIVHQYERGNAWVPAIRERYTGLGQVTKTNLDELIAQVQGTLKRGIFERFKDVARAYINTKNNQPHSQYLEDQMASIAPDIMFHSMRSVYEDKEHNGPRDKRSAVLVRWLTR